MYYVYQLEKNARVTLNLLSPGLERKVKCYNNYFINGHVFHTEDYGEGKKIYNSRVCIKGLISNKF